MNQPTAHESATQTIRSLALAKAIGIGFGVTVLCILPPIINAVTWPIGMLLGGFIAGKRMKAMWRTGIALGLGIGLCYASLFGIFLFFFTMTPSASTFPFVSSQLRVLTVGLAGASAFVSIVASIGAIVGGFTARKKAVDGA